MTSLVRRTASIFTKTNLLICVLSVLVVFASLKFTFVIEDRWGHDAFIRWGGLAGFTLGLFGLFVADNEKFLRKWRFWVVTAILLMGHLAAFVILLSHVDEWKLPWFMVMVIEYPIFIFLRDIFVSPVAKTSSADDRDSS
jgi:peptidoglycan/LPS O-acetylase OafA/YrhL